MSQSTEISYALQAKTKLKDGQYEIVKILGAGGMGITYLATKKADTAFEDDEQLVIKELFIAPNTANAYCTRNQKNNLTVIPEGGLRKSFASFKTRFLNEAKTLHKFKGLEGMVQVKDLFEENDTVYFSMGYIAAQTLKDYVTKKGKLPFDEAFRLLERIGKLLAAIHKENALHRDVKPENILIDKQQNAYLIDFGIAKEYDEMGVVTTITAMGTRRYAPPEQLTGDKDLISPAIDVFAYASTFYFCLTGTEPQTGDENSYKGYKTVNDLTPINNTLNHSIENARNRNPKERTQTIAAFLNELAGEQKTKKTAKPTKNTSKEDEKTVILLLMNKPK